MGCNCKDKANTAKKYTDSETMETLEGARKVSFMIRQIITVLLLVIVFIIAFPLFIINSVIRIITGNSLKINVTNFIRLFNVRHE